MSPGRRKNGVVAGRVCLICKLYKLAEHYSKTRNGGCHSYCKPCMAAKNRALYSTPEGKAYKAAHHKKYYAANKEQFCAKRRAWAAKNKEYVRRKGLEWKRKTYWRRHLKKMYGITPGQYDSMFNAQAGRCFICLDSPSEKSKHGRTLVVDHCHGTGRVRHLLCKSCNSVLGLARERVSVLLAAAQYLTDEQEESAKWTSQSASPQELTY